MSGRFSSQLILSILTGVLTAGITVAALFFRVRLSRELNRRERQRERWLSRHDELTWNRNSLDSDHEENILHFPIFRQNFRSVKRIQRYLLRKKQRFRL